MPVTLWMASGCAGADSESVLLPNSRKKGPDDYEECQGHQQHRYRTSKEHEGIELGYDHNLLQCSLPFGHEDEPDQERHVGEIELAHEVANHPEYQHHHLTITSNIEDCPR